MSSVIKTNTMFVDEECLIKAIEANGTKVTSHNVNVIVTNRVDFYGAERFVLENGRYVFMHDSTADRLGNRYPWNRNSLKNWKNVSEWLSDVNRSYVKEYEAKLECLAEEERRREEERLRRLVEDRRDQIKAKAKEEGYYIKETEEDGTIRLVLTRVSYRHGLYMLQHRPY